MNEHVACFFIHTLFHDFIIGSVVGAPPCGCPFRPQARGYGILFLAANIRVARIGQAWGGTSGKAWR